MMNHETRDELLIAMAKSIGWMQATIQGVYGIESPYEAELIKAIGKAKKEWLRHDPTS